MRLSMASKKSDDVVEKPFSFSARIAPWPTNSGSVADSHETEIWCLANEVALGQGEHTVAVGSLNVALEREGGGGVGGLRLSWGL